MEEICDWVTIKRSGDKAYAYGQLLLKSMRVLQAESEDFNMYATFAGDKEYQSVRQRGTRIAGYKPYKGVVAVSTLVATMLCVVVAFLWTQNVSYERNYNMGYDFSALMGGTTNPSSNLLSDYASIKNGSYGKLLKAYYAKQDAENASVSGTAGRN